MFLLCSVHRATNALHQQHGGQLSSRKKRAINLPAPYLRWLWLDPARITNRQAYPSKPIPPSLSLQAYPYCLPFLGEDFELRFERAITIVVGENGTGKSTPLEGIAVLAGYDEARGGKGL
jgi:hypothetical protein